MTNPAAPITKIIGNARINTVGNKNNTFIFFFLFVISNCDYIGESRYSIGSEIKVFNCRFFAY
jgi:hypothetical protein